MECRIRRLEIGRRRAKEKRLEKGVQELAIAATEWREMRNEDRNGATVRSFLTCNTATLAAAKASFSALVAENPGQENEVSLAKEHIVIVRDVIVQEIGRGPSKRRRGIETKLADTNDGRNAVGEATSYSKEQSSAQRSSIVLEELTEQKAEGVQETQDPQAASFVHEADDKKDGESPDARPSGPSPEDTVNIPTLEEVLRALTGLEQALDAGSIGLTAFVVWWVNTVSAAELALKSTFLNPSAKRKTWRN